MTTELIIHKNLQEVTPSQWEELLQSNTGNFFQTPAALDFFHSVGIETFTLVVQNEARIVASLSGIIQKEKGLKATFTSRAIVYGGPMFSAEIEHEETVELLRLLISDLKEKVIYIEFRNLNDYSDFSTAFEEVGFVYHPHLNFHLDCTDMAAMKKRMSSSKLRQVKKSIKEGAAVIEATTTEQIAEFYAILLHLYKTKVKTPLPDLDFFVELWKSSSVTFLLIEYQNEIIGGIVAPILKHKVIYEWFVCGKDGVYKNVYPSILATWAAMEYASENGIARFDFMGAGKPDEDYGVREFKSKFGGELVQHGRYRYVAKPFLYELGKTAVKILKS